MNFEDYESLPTTNVQTHMVAGAAAGVMEHCVMYPLDSVKTRMQSLTTSSQTGRGMGEVFRGMVAQEGVLRPLRGVNAVILGAAPAHALYFSCYEYLKDTFTNRTLINNNVGYGLAGGMATMLHDGIMTPADVVKQRLQMYNSPYRSMLETIRTVYRTEGLVAFYRSYTTQLAMNVPFQSIHFITYEVIYYTIRTVYRTEGLVAFYRSYTTQLAMNVPFQSIHFITYEVIYYTIRTVYRTEGLVAFYRSYTTQLAMNVPFQSIHFITYEVMQTITNPSRSYNPIAHMMSGAISGGVAAAITTPLDVCKTFLNTQQSKVSVKHQ
ncbi:mitoferrin-2 isoform X2 [Diaphorina citri]|uniref:Mitoferrin-2 isoform X2 n=1 Tax=Diaphorina citri TaxID=121845 RepID=A0A3Q0IYA4_DIACI|nr:mitoferrin-2 isoform X2 [Diaphorina citri]